MARRRGGGAPGSLRMGRSMGWPCEWRRGSRGEAGGDVDGEAGRACGEAEGWVGWTEVGLWRRGGTTGLEKRMAGRSGGGAGAPADGDVGDRERWRWV